MIYKLHAEELCSLRMKGVEIVRKEGATDLVHLTTHYDSGKAVSVESRACDGDICGQAVPDLRPVCASRCMVLSERPLMRTSYSRPCFKGAPNTRIFKHLGSS